MKTRIPSDIIKLFEPLGAVLIDEPLSRHTSFKTGGPADLMLLPSGVAELARAVRLCAEHGLSRTVVGGGSNLLVGDRGIRGLTLCLSAKALGGEKLLMDDDFILSSASLRKKEFVTACAAKGLAGMEFMAGIPGCMGGGIIMNAGTVDGNFADILKRIEYVDAVGEVKRRDVNPSMAGYRHLNVEDGAVITAGWFRLRRAEDPETVRRRIREILDERAKKHPLDYPSAGSVFKNPDGRSSWKLINDAGLKGRRVGGAMVSELHTNFIINAGGASSGDIRGLIEIIREKVYNEFGVSLEPEVRLVGEF